MKASRYMKPPSCHKLARVTVRDAGPALGRPETHQDTQHAAHLIGEIRASERGWEATKGTASPCPSRGQTLPKWVVRATSAYPPIAITERTQRDVSNVASAEIAALFDAIVCAAHTHRRTRPT
jgi:hypothetical protein